ncbi:MAG TPA: ATP synthase F1 subunit gamma, partial [Cytophagaceae bacterium]|nr:ATP synthase F1 subunit gamma [Cytophagaceae bacterium]
LRRAQDNITRIRPYAEKLDGILSNLSASLEDASDNIYASEREIKRVLIVAITSDRGLAGAFNANILKAANAYVNTHHAAAFAMGNVEFMALGKKAFEALQRRKDVSALNGDYAFVFGNLTFDTARPAAEWVMERYVSGYYDKVVVIYNEFKNVATQIVRTEQFLPIVAPAATTATSTSSTDYIFEPTKEEIVEELIPKSLKIKFYKYLLESYASENGARMTAMDKATDNAKELLKSLKLEYNRSRQAAITKEILEIVGGAEALNG